MNTLAAYAEVAERIRQDILSGRLKVGQRLPSEAELCEEFGVARSTIREALRSLASRQMVVTTRGVYGGSAVARLAPADASEMLMENIILLTQSENATVEEILETRALLEVPAARLAATRRSAEQLESLRETIPASVEKIRPEEIFSVNRSFHDVLLDAAGNRMLSVVTEPMFLIMQTRFLRHRSERTFLREVADDHAAIYAAVEAGDADRAGHEMEKHLAHLHMSYQSVDQPPPGSRREPRKRSRKAPRATSA